ncbi:MAG: serine/threonine protein kinase [Candidatus Hydrogenedentes bacterium]|nr:serine/threonine protein kinase [Candidatus Hydrogenedentota bacterium]
MMDPSADRPSIPEHQAPTGSNPPPPNVTALNPDLVDSSRLSGSTLGALEDLVGQTVDNFRVLSLLGSGGFGAVYKAMDLNLGREVALKFLHGPLQGQARKLFEREARALAALSKEAGIVEIYQWGHRGDVVYLVLELVDGSTEKLLEDYPEGLPIARALQLAADCAEALAFAHGQGILHRDIKPANILVDGHTGRAKLADFGLARVSVDSEMSLTGGISGSPPYMSPEQATGDELDARSDIFSLGVTLYQLLCGARPFEGRSAQQVMSNIRKNERVPLPQRRNDLPQRIVAIVDRATAHEPNARYATAKEFARDLRNVLHEIERKGQVDTIRKVPAPRRYTVVLVAVASVAAIAGGLYILGALQGAEPGAGGAHAADSRAVYADVREDVETGQYDAAREKLDAAQAASGGDDLIVTAYLKLIEEKEKPGLSADTLEVSRRIRDRLDSGQIEPVQNDGWTSRPLSFFVLPCAISGNSEYVPGNGLSVEVVDIALDEVLLGLDFMDFTDRDQIAALVQEQELSANLSSDTTQLQLGKLIGARLMIKCTFTKLGLNAPEKLVISLQDVEDSSRFSAGPLTVGDYASPEALLDAARDAIRTAVLGKYPLKGRLYRVEDHAEINLGQNVRLGSGMRFDVRPRADLTPLAGAAVAVSGPVMAATAVVDVTGIPLEELPASPGEGLFVQIMPETPAV